MKRMDGRLCTPYRSRMTTCSCVSLCVSPSVRACMYACAPDTCRDFPCSTRLRSIPSSHQHVHVHVQSGCGTKKPRAPMYCTAAARLAACLTQPAQVCVSQASRPSASKSITPTHLQQPTIRKQMTHSTSEATGYLWPRVSFSFWAFLCCSSSLLFLPSRVSLDGDCLSVINHMHAGTVSLLGMWSVRALSDIRRAETASV